MQHRRTGHRDGAPKVPTTTTTTTRRLNRPSQSHALLYTGFALPRMYMALPPPLSCSCLVLPLCVPLDLSLPVILPRCLEWVYSCGLSYVVCVCGYHRTPSAATSNPRLLEGGGWGLLCVLLGAARASPPPLAQRGPREGQGQGREEGAGGRGWWCFLDERAASTRAKASCGRTALWRRSRRKSDEHPPF